MPAQTFNGDAPPPSRLQIGDWWADRSTNELGRNGAIVRIEPKAMEVLIALADRAGQVVGREELLRQVWPGAVVGDEALTQSIIKLRRALGDNSRSPSYIETISKRGYRLVAPVRKVGTPSATRVGEHILSPPQPSERMRVSTRTRALAAGVVFAVLLGGVYFRYPPPNLMQDFAGDLGNLNEWDMPRSPIVTVTVLPFESLGAGDAHEYLVHGISNDLVTDLSRLSGLRLISSSYPKGSTQASRSARYLVAGSVQREYETLRVNVRLIDGRTNELLWTERFEKPFRELFSVQDAIVRRLLEKLPGEIKDVERKHLAKRYTQSLEAYEHFLRGQELFLARRTDDNEQARSLFRRAVELDPKFARAYASLALTYAMDHRLRLSGDASRTLARAFELAETARLIDPDIPEIYWAIGFVHLQYRRYDRAIESLQEALKLHRSYADAYALLGGIYSYIGQPKKTIPLLRTAMQLNPDGGYLYFQILGRAYLFDNDVEQALINLREASARNPVDLETRVYLTAAMVAAGDRSGAEWEAEEIRALDARFSVQKLFEAYPISGTKVKQMLSGLLANAGFPE